MKGKRLSGFLLLSSFIILLSLTIYGINQLFFHSKRSGGLLFIIFGGLLGTFWVYSDIQKYKTAKSDSNYSDLGRSKYYLAKSVCFTLCLLGTIIYVILAWSTLV